MRKAPAKIKSLLVVKLLTASTLQNLIYPMVCNVAGSSRIYLADIFSLTAQVMKDEQGRPFIIVREYVGQAQNSPQEYSYWLKCDKIVS